MSDPGEQNLDFQSVISKIMENPKLVEKIGEALSEDGKSGSQIVEETANPPVKTVSNEKSDGNRREKLLGALRPYLSRERQKLLDSMMAVLCLLETMGRSN